MRKMAEVVQISDVVPHPNADQLEFCLIEGWRCIVKKGEFQPGQLAVFLQPDAWSPNTLTPFLEKEGRTRFYNGIPGSKIKTIRLRGEVSQGLVLPLSVLPADTGHYPQIGDDVSEILGVQKWEPAIPACLAGKMKGNFPFWGRKTDQERIQSCFRMVKGHLLCDVWTIEEKLDGSSMSVGKFHDDIVVCSRNLSLDIENPENRVNNSFVRTAYELNMIEGLRILNRNIMISGELIGPGIQGNLYKRENYEWHVFDILDVDSGKYVTSQERMEILTKLNDITGKQISHVPVIDHEIIFPFLEDTEFFLNYAEGKSVLNPKQDREGLVFKNQRDPDISFKAISRKFLLKHQDDE